MIDRFDTFEDILLVAFILVLELNGVKYLFVALVVFLNDSEGLLKLFGLSLELRLLFFYFFTQLPNLLSHFVNIIVSLVKFVLFLYKRVLQGS